MLRFFESNLEGYKFEKLPCITTETLHHHIKNFTQVVLYNPERFTHNSGDIKDSKRKEPFGSTPSTLFPDRNHFSLNLSIRNKE